MRAPAGTAMPAARRKQRPVAPGRAGATPRSDLAVDAAGGVAAVETAPGATAVDTSLGEDAPVTPSPAGGHAPVAAATRASRSELRDEAARAQLEPLAPGERPVPLVVAAVVAALLAVAVIVGATTVHDLSSRGGSIPGAVVLAGVLAAASWGMWHRRYGAVLGFEALLAFQMVVTSLALLVAQTIPAAVGCTVSVLLSGWLFWKLIRVLGRIDVTRRMKAGAAVDAPAARPPSGGRSGG